MSKQKRPSIYLNPPLAKVKADLREGQSFSARLGEIAERYALICRQVPELSDGDKTILGNTLSGSLVEPLLILHLGAEIEDSDAADESALRALAEHVRGMSIAERVALIESLGF